MRISGTKRSNNWFCDHSKLSWHTYDRCYKLHGYPQGWNHNKDRKYAHMTHYVIDDEDNQDSSGSQVGNQNTGFQSWNNFPATNPTSTSTAPTITQEQYQQLMSLLSKHNSEISDSLNKTSPANGNAFMAGASWFFSSYRKCLLSTLTPIWIIDSGATDHICHDLKLFHKYESVKGNDKNITVPDGRKVNIKHVGTVKLNDHVILDNVFHVPEFRFNLISIHKLCQNLKVSAQFTPTECIIQGQHMITPQVLGRIFHGLYYTSPWVAGSSHSSSPGCCNGTANNTAIEAFKLWHLRLGHIPFN